MAASLAGLEAASGSATSSRASWRSGALLVLYAAAFAHGGLPLIYMGDELGMLNDASWADDPRHRDDNRWMHRPFMDWEAVERRGVLGSVEAALFAGERLLVLASFSADEQPVRDTILEERGLSLSGPPRSRTGGRCEPAPASWSSRRTSSPGSRARRSGRARRGARRRAMR